MKGKIFVEKNKIINWMPENPTGDTEGIRLAMDVLDNLVSENPPAHILVDLSKAHRPDANARALIIDTIRRNSKSIKKIALCGHSPLMKAVSYFVINTSGYNNMQFFSSRHEAAEWLLRE